MIELTNGYHLGADSRQFILYRYPSRKPNSTAKNPPLPNVIGYYRTLSQLTKGLLERECHIATSKAATLDEVINEVIDTKHQLDKHVRLLLGVPEMDYDA